MKIISLLSSQEYDIYPKKSGENAMPCPECSAHRKNKTAKPFSWNNQKQAGYCNHCEAKFVIKKENNETIVSYVKPIVEIKTSLSDKAVKYFESRMISKETCNKMKLYSCIEWMPKNNKKVDTICFPFYFDGELINIKYRGPGKDFKLFKDAELIFYNIDVVLKYDEIIIVEGEIDALSMVEAGLDNVISVPNGANGNTSYIENYLYLFDQKTIILAVDNDVKGLNLRKDLILKFGIENCKIANLKEFKDANEILCEKGAEALREVVNSAKFSIDYEKNNPYNLFQNSLLDINETVLPPLDVVKVSEQHGFETVEKRFQTLGNISMIQGKAKTGKTYLLSMILPSIISNGQNENFIGKWVSTQKCGVFYFDTEQAEYDGMQVLQRIVKQCSYYENFGYSCLREYNPLERMQIIETAIEKFSENLCYVVIDGVADLLYSLNDEKESTELTSKLMKLSKMYNVHICVILHENKSKVNNVAQGWLGTMLYKKCETVVSVKNTDENDTKSVQSEMQRGTMPFNQFSYKIDFQTKLAKLV